MPVSSDTGVAQDATLQAIILALGGPVVGMPNGSGTGVAQDASLQQILALGAVGRPISVATVADLAAQPAVTAVQGSLAFVQANGGSYWSWYPTGSAPPAGAVTTAGNGGVWALALVVASTPQETAVLNPYVILAGAAMWWDVGAQGVTAGGVPDNTGNGHPLATAGINPTLGSGGQGGRPYLRFNGTTQALLITGNPTVVAPGAIWGVFRTSASTGTDQCVVSLTNGLNLFAVTSAGGSTAIGSYINGWSLPGTVAGSSGFPIAASIVSSVAVALSASFNAGNSVGQYRSNGVADYTAGHGGPYFAQGGAVGAAWDGVVTFGNFLAGDFYEAAVFDFELTPLELAALDAYGAIKYQLTLTPNLLVMDGNSFVAGVGASGPSYYLGQQVLGLLGTTFGTTYVNHGVSGETTPQMDVAAAAFTDPLYSRGVVPLCVDVGVEGTNDIYFGASTATAYANTVAYCQARRVAGFKVIIPTLVDRSNAGTPPTFLASITAYNAMIMSSWPTFCDGVADIASDPRFQPGWQTNPLYSPDLVHGTDLTYGIWAGYYAAAIKALPGA